MKFKPGPVGQAFIDNRKFVKIICGPVGGGKSTDACFELFYRMVEQAPFENVRRTKMLLVRNTMQQLKSTVRPLLDTWFRELIERKMAQWKITDATLEFRFQLPDGTIVHSDWMLMPADTPDDVRRLLSLEASAAWVEECREIDETVFEALQGRVMRFPSVENGGITYSGVIGSTNPPPMGTWLQERMADPPGTWGVFMQPPALLPDGTINPEAENLDHLDPDYYPNLMQGKTEGWLDVYMRNKFGAGGFGMPVFHNTFRRDFHVSAEPLKAVSSSNYPIVVGMDNGLTAAAVIGQMDARGRVNILDEAYVPDGQTMGVETFLDRILVPILVAKYGRPENILFVLDEACYQRSQVNEVTIAQAVAARRFMATRAATNKPERRIAAVEGLLNRAIDGQAGMLFSPTCDHLIKAMDWGYRNKKLQSGVTTAIPEKNHWSHIADALQYLSLHYNVIVNPASFQRRNASREVKVRPFTYV